MKCVTPASPVFKISVKLLRRRKLKYGNVDVRESDMFEWYLNGNAHTYSVIIAAVIGLGFGHFIGWMRCKEMIKREALAKKVVDSMTIET